MMDHVNSMIRMLFVCLSLLFFFLFKWMDGCGGGSPSLIWHEWSCFALTVSLNGFISINECRIQSHKQKKIRPITNYTAFHIMPCVLFIAVGIFGFYFRTDDKQTKKRHYSQRSTILYPNLFNEMQKKSMWYMPFEWSAGCSQSKCPTEMDRIEKWVSEWKFPAIKIDTCIFVIKFPFVWLFKQLNKHMQAHTSLSHSYTSQHQFTLPEKINHFMCASKITFFMAFKFLLHCGFIRLQSTTQTIHIHSCARNILHSFDPITTMCCLCARIKYMSECGRTCWCAVQLHYCVWVCVCVSFSRC